MSRAPLPAWEEGALHVKGSRVHVADLIRELAFVLDQPGPDKTGFTGEFDLNLDFCLA